MYITERLPKETGRDYALRVLKDNIIRLELEPGSMVSENELSSSLGLSRTPIREALIELSKVDIVEIYPQKGSRIALIDPDLVEQAYFMRRTLECAVIREVARKASKEDLACLGAAIDSQEEFAKKGNAGNKGEDGLTFMELDNRFHELLYRIAKKELVHRITMELLIHFDRIRVLTIDYYQTATITEDHKEILQALEEGDADLASALTGRHLGRFLRAWEELREKYPHFFREE